MITQTLEEDMAPDKIAFTSRDLEAAFGLSNREQVYFVDRGHLVPDIQADRPRLYSLYSAMKAGALQFFERHGYKLDRADRLAEFAMVTASMASNKESGPAFRDDLIFSMNVIDGISGAIYLQVPGEEQSPFLIFAAATTVESEEALRFNKMEYISICKYNLKSLWEMLAGKLDADWRNIGKLPKHVDEKISVLRGDKDIAAGTLIFKSDSVKEIKLS